MNAAYVGEDTSRRISVTRVVLVILNAPQGTSPEDVRQRLAAGFGIRENAEIISELEWPVESAGANERP
jgi:hypothetical protein